jgi:hypothetical protein
MIIKKINDRLSITGEVYSNSRAWGHEVRAIYNGSEYTKNRVRYYNRTWERYQFESAWQGLLDKLDKENFIPLADRVALALALKA